MGTGKHQNCGRTAEPPLLPTRVIDVGSSDADAHLHLSHTGEKSHYVALSHCWGGVVSIMSTTSTVPKFAKALPSEMPKTFADAIALTRALWTRCILRHSSPSVRMPLKTVFRVSRTASEECSKSLRCYL